MAKKGRLSREMKMLCKKSRPGVFLGPKNDCLDEFEASITGVEGTPYENGVFELEIKVPDTYPFCAPLFRFITKVYHPNIDNHGRICLKSLKPPPAGDWSPALTLIDVLSEIRLLLGHPNPDDSLMPDIAQQYLSDRSEFDRKARSMTQQYASLPSTSTSLTSSNGENRISTAEFAKKSKEPSNTEKEKILNTSQKMKKDKNEQV